MHMIHHAMEASITNSVGLTFLFVTPYERVWTKLSNQKIN